MDQAWLDELSELIRIPSVSADPAHAGDVRDAAAWVRDFVRKAGGEAELVDRGAPAPLVIGEIRASSGAADAPTVLLYGHFDVQPPAPLELWDSPPFDLTVNGEWLVAVSHACCSGRRARPARRDGTAGPARASRPGVRAAESGLRRARSHLEPAVSLPRGQPRRWRAWGASF